VSEVIDQRNAEIIFLMTQIEDLKKQLRNNRWNIRESGTALVVCKGDHEKSEGCQEKWYVPEEERITLANINIDCYKRIGVLEIEIQQLKQNIILTNDRAVYWQDKYNRDVEGLNNEGDAIGGEPPSGLRHRVDYLLKENERLRSLLPPQPDTRPSPYWGYNKL